MDTSNLSSKTTKCISELDVVRKEDLGKICKYFMQSLVKGSTAIALDASLDDSLCAVSTLLLEAAKLNCTVDNLKSILAELGTGLNVIEILSALYHEHLDTIREHLNTTGIAAPTIVGVDWRLDYSIKSKHGGRENAPMFYVCLRVKESGGLLRDISMMASMEQLQDLLSKVKDAVKQTDRLLHGGGSLTTRSDA
mmetsp:Transcript_29064/g.48850  ORF Transcript_29064/g.48850 Transcript_29064/m.48850 type:complete len:195 (+) Transcript_29064:86-670(+)